MGLRDSLLSTVASAISAVSDLGEQVTYNQVTSEGAYDPATNSYVGKTVISIGPIAAIPVNERKDEDDYQPVDEDTRKLLIAASDLGITPKIQDTVTYSDSSVQEITKVKYVPGRSLWILTVRNP